MDAKIRNKIVAKIKAAPRGKLFIIADFDSLGSYSAVRKELSELVKRGWIDRVATGIYLKPDFNNFLNCKVPATPAEIAATIARKNGWTIVPSKDSALNILGLDTQVPNTYEYVSDGPTKMFELKNGRIIKFRHVTQREILMNPTSAIVVEAFKQLGKEGVTEEVLRQIQNKLADKQLGQLNEDVANTRVWIKEKVKELNGVKM